MSTNTKADTQTVAERLRGAYGDFAHGNKRRAFDELLYILSSIKTTERKHAESYRSLRRAFPTYADIAEATEDDLADALSVGGFQTIKAQTIRRAVDAIVERFGRPTLAPLRRMDDDDAERELLALPGVGPKIARCVMMYSLDREVFPVDTNCWRIAVRLGWIDPKEGGRQITAKDMEPGSRSGSRPTSGTRSTSTWCLTVAASARRSGPNARVACSPSSVRESEWTVSTRPAIRRQASTSSQVQNRAPTG